MACRCGACTHNPIFLPQFVTECASRGFTYGVVEGKEGKPDDEGCGGTAGEVPDSVMVVPPSQATESRLSIQ